MIPNEILFALKNWLRENNFSDKILQYNSISGGSINAAFKISTETENWFLKYNDAKAFPKMFESEYYGLELLGKTKTIRVPKPYYFFEGNQYSFILMEWIEEKKKVENFWEDFAKNLAKLHLHSNDYFGLDFHNYMGSLSQRNEKETDFISFFINHRLKPQLALAIENRFLNKKHINACENLYKELLSIIPIEKPSLLHGDLWIGNFMADETGSPVILDPAIYYGHREVDLAMTTLFGGFSDKFYNAYQNYFPLEKDWESRLPYYNLYPILIHINLFGSSYVSAFEKIIYKFS